jgi:hypothetical protein
MADGEVSQGRRIVRPILAAIALLFVAHTAHGLWRSWDGIAIQVRWEYFALSFVPAGLAMIAQLVAWQGLIRSWTSHQMPSRAAAKLYLDSQMARYTPGKVGLPLVRMGGAEAVGVAKGVMGSALFAEVVSWCGVGSLVGGATLGLFSGSTGLGRELSLGSLILGGVAGGGVLIFVLVDRRRFPVSLRHLMGEGGGTGPLLPWTMPAWHLLHYFLWILSGMLLCRAVGGTWEAGILAGAILCLAIIAGFLAFLAPAGAGVREAVLAAGTAPLLGPGAGLALGILARVVSLATDVLLWAWFRARAATQEPGR